METNRASAPQRYASSETVPISDRINTALEGTKTLINIWNSQRAQTARINQAREQLRFEHEQILEAMKMIKEERTGLFEQYFSRLDTAIEHEDTKLALSLLTNISELAAKAPFADLKDIRVVRQNLADPNHDWKL